MAKQHFFEIFKRYTPEGERRELLSSGGLVDVRICREPFRVEVDIPFDTRKDYRLLYRIEDELCELYEARSFRIFPKYVPSLFSLDVMPEVLAEAERIGAVTHGFFLSPHFSLEADKLQVELPFTESGIDLLGLAKTDRTLEGIIRSRYGKEIQVEIRPTADAAEQTGRRQKEMEDSLAALDREIRAQAEEMRRASALREKHTGADAGEPEEHADFRHIRSLRTDLADRPPETVGDGLLRVGSITFLTAEPEVLLGSAFAIENPTPMAEIREGSGITLLGKIFEVTRDENRTGDRIRLRIGFSDGSSSVYLRMNQTPEEVHWADSLSPGKCIAAAGRVMRDKFDGELVFSPRQIMKIGQLNRTDNAEEKRVELHLHTNMSAMDAIIRPDELVRTAAAWGHRAIAVTDHGNVQAFPEVMLALEKQKCDLKILYGMEAYFVNDTARVIYGPKNPDFGDEVVVFDIETTGLSPVNCHITEIGAVKIRGGEVLDTFDTFVNPEVPIPPEITRLTSITDEMVKDAPLVGEALEQFFRFIGDDMLIAHNANFDVGFIRTYAEKCGLDFHSTYLDTVALSHYVNPSLKNHKLDTIAAAYHLGDFHHHRASDDAAMLAAIYTAMINRLMSEGVNSFPALLSAMRENADPLQIKPRHMVILAKNKEGLKNLYRLISASYLTYFKRYPRIPKSLLETHREGLLIGSACEAGELFQALLEGRPEAELEEIASFYDYLEIQPLCNNRFLIAAGRVAGDEQLKMLNRRIIEIGKRIGKPTVATCDAHFLEKEDEIYRKILLAGQKYADADKDVGIYLRTTEEMLAEFAYLGEDLAREVVIENPNKIADMVEKIRPIPEGRYEPSIPGADEDLTRICWQRAHDWYGEEIPEIVSARLKKELDSIIQHGFAVLYMIAQKLVSYSESLGYLVGSRGSVGSSFVASMAGISEVNPLPPHYRCLKCKYSEFITDGSVGSGFDLPDKDCPVCGAPLFGDGHDIPFETFLGFKGDKSPDIDLNFSGDVQGKVHKYTEVLFGEGHVFRAGTIGTLASKTAYGYVMKYLEDKKVVLPKAEVSRLTSRCEGIKRSTGQHPGGIIVVPKEFDIYDFSPVQHPADDPNSDIITTHFQFSYLHDTILKLDELGHDMPTKYKMLEKYTNTSVMDVKMNDRKVYELFESTAPLGVTSEEIHSRLGTFGIPEMGTQFGQQLLIDAKPKNFADLLQVSGLSHGTGVWLGNAQDLIKNGTCTISEVVGTRDGIMLYLIRHGLENGLAFKIMEAVRKGKGLTPEFEAAMREHNVPDWYISSCKKIKYMFPKAHAAAYVMSAIRLGWYKIYYPMEFYAAFLTVAPGGFDAEIVGQGKNFVYETIAAINKKGNEATQKEKDMVTTLELVGECLCRGIKFLPVSIWKSDANAFLPEDGNIRMPFSALPGLGESVAQKILQLRHDGGPYSVEDLRHKAGVSKAVVELLRRNHALDGLNETNQYTLF